MSGLVLLLENVLFPFGALAIVLSFLFSSRRRVLLSLSDELRERLGGLGPEQLSKLQGRRVLWVHAASAGEVAAVSGLLQKLKAGKDPPAVLLTTTTMTGREKAAALAHADAASLAPLDFYPAVSRFLSAAKPSALVVVETELWPQTLSLAKRRGLKIALVNGRMTERSFGRYRLLAPCVRPFLSLFDRLAVQSEADAQRYLALGARPEAVSVVGNMKYDRLASVANDPEIGKRLSAMGWDGLPVWVAGSTHPIEEELVLTAFAAAKVKVPALKLVLAPRHPERADQAAAAIEKAGVPFSRWSAAAAPSEALLLDGLGVLPKMYPFAKVSFVGGTLVPVGGHNLLEPAIAGSPVLFGPHTSHTADTATMLSSAGCGFCVNDAKELAAVLTDLLKDEPRRAALGAQARRLVERLRGTIDRTLAHAAPVLFP